MNLEYTRAHVGQTAAYEIQENLRKGSASKYYKGAIGTPPQKAAKNNTEVVFSTKVRTVKYFFMMDGETEKGTCLQMVALEV